jgi:hypothetical protein
VGQGRGSRLDVAALARVETLGVAFALHDVKTKHVDT